MNNECVFCRIIKGEIKPHKLFEDEKTLAFLDANPLAKGHTLLIPKQHISKLEKLNENFANALFSTLYKLVEPIQKGVEAPASTIAINNGEQSGQDVPHVHVHIVPRFEGDKGGSLHSIMGQIRPRINQYEMKEIAESIRSLL